MLTFTAYTNAIPSQAYTIKNIISADFSTNIFGGYIDCNIDINREPGHIPIEFIPLNHLDVRWNGIVVWEGRIHAVPQTIGVSKSYKITAVGYNMNFSDLTSSWKPNYTSLTDTVSIIRDGIASYCLQLSTNTTIAPNSGRTIQYFPDNYGSVNSHMQNLLKYGDTNNRELVWQVWNDRLVYINSRPSLTVADYEVSNQNIENADVGINSDNFYTRVTVKYKTPLDILYLTVNTTSYQTKYASVFGSNNPSATPVNFIREPEIIDITSHGNITTAQATFVANTLLNKYSANGLRLTSSKISIKNPAGITQATNQTSIPLPQIRAGKVLLFKDLSGTDSGLTAEQASMLIAQTKCAFDSNGISLEIDSEASVSNDLFLSSLLAGIQAQPE